jgi:hypothetical protein
MRDFSFIAAVHNSVVCTVGTVHDRIEICILLEFICGN